MKETTNETDTLNVVAHSATTPSQDLELINKFTRRKLDANEVYTFSVILCDNEIDRDFERFTLSSLEEISKLFVGKTGIFDHNPKGENQTARIFFAEVIVDDKKMNSIGIPYTYVKAKAYMVKSKKNIELILDIDAGIKKEVSVSCSAKSVTCSICKKNKNECHHEVGKIYDNKICHRKLSNITDAYEWSFVAIPAQINAGVTKSFKKNNLKGGEIMRNSEEIIKSFSLTEDIVLNKGEKSCLLNYINELKQESSLGKAYKQDLQSQVTHLAFLSESSIPNEVMESVCKKMNIIELKAFKETFEKKLNLNDDFEIQCKNNFSHEQNAADFKM